MKFLLTLFLLLLAMVVRGAQNPAFTDLVQTNILWVSKNGNNSTAKPGNPALEYLTISNAVQAGVKPAVVKVAPGVYNESVNLKDGVDIHLDAGASIDFTSAGALHTVTDNNVALTNRITGYGIIRRTGANVPALKISSDSLVSVEVNYVELTGNTSLGAVRVDNSSGLRFKGRVFSGGTGMNLDGHVETVNSIEADVNATNNYGVNFGSGTNYFTGTVRSKVNSATTVTGGNAWTFIENSTLYSSNLFGMEVAGGLYLEIKNSILQSDRGTDASGNAISKYGGATMVLDDVQLTAGPNNLHSIDNGGVGSHGSVEIRGTCWANRPPNPIVNITQGGVTVTNALYSKQEQAFTSVHGITNVVLQTNGNTALPNGLDATFIPVRILGAGNGNTNYTLLVNTNFVYLGSSNVNISAAMQGIAGKVKYFTVVVTNLSADTWGFQVSSVTNRWRFFSPMYGTNAPVTLTNNTALVLDCKSEGTNIFVRYEYYCPGL